MYKYISSGGDITLHHIKWDNNIHLLLTIIYLFSHLSIIGVVVFF